VRLEITVQNSVWTGLARHRACGTMVSSTSFQLVPKSPDDQVARRAGPATGLQFWNCKTVTGRWIDAYFLWHVVFAELLGDG
jgi:hypothetical protein